MKRKLTVLLAAFLLATAGAFAQVSVSLAPVAKQQFLDSNGAPVVGGKLCTYVTGTTTPQATYTDSSGTTTNTNPIVLDSAGRASIWLPQGVQFRFTLYDSTGTPNTCDGNLIWQQDGVSSVSLSSGGVMGGTFSGNPIFSGNPAFTGNPTVTGSGASGVVALPVIAGQVFNVKAYGAKGDGTNDDTTAIQSVITAIRVATGNAPGAGAKYTASGTIYFPPGTYKVSQLDLTDTQGLKIVGSGYNSTVIKCSEASAGTGVCLDMSGSNHAVVEDFEVGDDTNGPKVELLIGKTAQNPDANYNYFRIGLAPTTATYGLFEYGSEDTTFVDPVFWATGTSIPAVISSLNSLGVSSPFTTLATGGQSMSTVTFIGGRIVAAGAQCVLLDDYNGSTFKSMSNIRFLGTFFGLTGASTVGIEDNSSATSGNTLYDFEIHSRFELDNSSNEAINIYQTVENWVLNVGYGYSGTLAGFAYNFVGHFINSVALFASNDTGSAHAGGSFTAHSAEGSLISGPSTISALGSASSGAIIEGNAYMSKYYLPGNSNQTITGANGAPSGGCQAGSMYLNSTGGAGTTLYVCEAGAWAAK